MDRKKYLIVTAGGSGSRMGASVPKQFLEIDGKPILRCTLEKFAKALPDLHIITVLPQANLEFWRNYCLKENFNCPQRLVVGGFTRFHSVQNALQHIPDGALVAVHDAVRPLISADKIRELFTAAASVPALIPIVPLTDTLIGLERLEDGSFRPTGEMPDRGRIFGAQTPQIFFSEVLKEAYKQGFDTAFTDDASVVRKFGVPLSYAQGERYNIKITTPEDLEVARSLF